MDTSALRFKKEFELTTHIKFWRDIFWREREFGCGAPDQVLHGWINVFDAYSERGFYSKSRTCEEFTAGAASVPFDIHYPGSEPSDPPSRDGMLVTGFVGQHIDGEKRTVRPVVGAFAFTYKKYADCGEMDAIKPSPCLGSPTLAELHECQAANQMCGMKVPAEIKTWFPPVHGASMAGNPYIRGPNRAWQ